jgi:hypothetical protein
MESSGKASVTQISYNGIDTGWWPGENWQFPGSMSQNQDREGTTDPINWLISGLFIEHWGLHFILLKNQTKWSHVL